MEMPDLLPCPFCGDSQPSIRLWSHADGNKEYTLQCSGCCANIGSVGFTAANGDTRKAASLLYDAWNTRADTAILKAKDAEIAELKAQLQRWADAHEELIGEVELRKRVAELEAILEARGE